ncbi:MAG: glycosyltransferase [Verrucomicrobiota bacterium]|nr:glycosyltransferase [Verrucomicrobiota bacterium]
MRLVIFGLTVSSSWGNGHATLWRGLIRALAERGHQVLFFEKDVPYYSAHRDLTTLPGAELHLYQSWEDLIPEARRHLASADVAMVTSYCPDGLEATRLILDSNAGLKVFYDLDTPVTLDSIRSRENLTYVGPDGFREFDLVLSYTGGKALEELKSELGARKVATLFGSVDPQVHFPVSPVEQYRADVTYLGTYAEDRQQRLNQLLIDPARLLPEKKFLIGGAQYPTNFPWTDNIYFVRHVPPSEHPAFYSSGRMTLNVTRRAMAEMGYCPSGRLFEAAACGTPILSDWWEGLDFFFQPGSEILIASNTAEAVQWMQLSDAELNRISKAARDRALDEHSATKRALELELILEETITSKAEPEIANSR